MKFKSDLNVRSAKNIVKFVSMITFTKNKNVNKLLMDTILKIQFVLINVQTNVYIVNKMLVNVLNVDFWM